MHRRENSATNQVGGAALQRYQTLFICFFTNDCFRKSTVSEFWGRSGSGPLVQTCALLKAGREGANVTHGAVVVIIRQRRRTSPP